MSRAWAFIALLAGGCNPPCVVPGLPAPMTEERGHQLAPEIATGLALSTTRIVGDCRPKAVDPKAKPACGADMLDCAHLREPLVIAAVPVNRSIPIDPGCDGDLLLAGVEAEAAVTATASAGGEAVIAVPAGSYTVFLSDDHRCATCGIAGSGAGCLIEVQQNHLSPRDLVIDRSTR